MHLQCCPALCMGRQGVHMSSKGIRIDLSDYDVVEGIRAQLNQTRQQVLRDAVRRYAAIVAQPGFSYEPQSKGTGNAKRERKRRASHGR